MTAHLSDRKSSFERFLRWDWLLLILSLLAFTVGIQLGFDNSGFYFLPFIGFFLTLAVIRAAIEIPSARQRLNTICSALADFLYKRGAFQSVSLNEVAKFSVIRVLFGLFLVERSIYVIQYAFPADWENFTQMFFMSTGLLAGIFILIGFATQLTLVWAILVQWKIGDLILGTSTLGNAVAAMLAILLIVSQAGSHYSVDNIIRLQPNSRFRFSLTLYKRDFLPSFTDLQIAKVSVLFAYSCVCVYSLSMHINESSWTTGVAGPQLLTNNFMSKYHYYFAEMFTYSPATVFIARLSMWLMMAWYILLFPAVLFGGFFRTYAIVWGLMFFFVSFFILQLGWLAHIEFLLWAALFWERRFIVSDGGISIIYDDRCNLCDRTVNFLMRVDLFKQLNFYPVSKNAPLLKEYEISVESALTDLYAIDRQNGDRLAAGYEMYMLITRRIFLLLPLFPVLFIGKIIRLGPMIYRWIADRRTRLFGVCQIGTPKPRSLVAENSTVQSRVSTVPLVIFVHIFILGVNYLLLLPAPYIGWQGVQYPRPVQAVTQNLIHQGYFYGIIPINVFNSVDLGMAKNWFTISSIGKNGREELVPLFAADGSRLAWHKSDRIYFGNTVQWRRGTIDLKEGCYAEDYAEMMKSFTSLAKTYRNVGDTEYVYRQYFQPLADPVELVKGKYVVSAPKIVCERKIEAP